MTDEETATLLTPEDVAHELRISIRTIRRWLGEGRIKGTKMGRSWRIRPDALDAFIDQSQDTHGLTLSIHIIAMPPTLYIHDESTGNDLGMPPTWWRQLALAFPGERNHVARAIEHVLKGYEAHS